MGILIDLKRSRYLNERAEMRTRFDICLTALQEYINDYFKPINLEIWRAQPVELDGEKIMETYLDNVSDVHEIQSRLSRSLMN